MLTLPQILSAQSTGIPSFVYHRFEEAAYPSTNISLDSFAAHLSYLQQHQIETITLSEALQRLEINAHKTQQVVALTIDDGYRSVYTKAFPLLQQYGFTATLFIATQQVGNGNQLTWTAIRELEKAGWEIGLHSHSHAYFLDQPKDQQIAYFEQDLQRAIQAYTAHLGHAPTLYAYPYGEYDTSYKAILKKYGIHAAAAQHSGVLSAHSPRFALPRFPMNERFGTTSAFQLKANTQPLPVLQLDYDGPIVQQQPPDIALQLDTAIANIDRLNCFWNGQALCKVHQDAQDTNTYHITIEGPIQGRRNKVTLTAPGPEPGQWYWYSIPVFSPKQ